eukprot:gene42208-57150_t
MSNSFLLYHIFSYSSSSVVEERLCVWGRKEDISTLYKSDAGRLLSDLQSTIVFMMPIALLRQANRIKLFEPSKDHGRVPARVVIGAGQDRIVDQEGLQETARYLGVQALQLPTLCHDIMLVSEWRVAADLIAEQLIQISNT